VQRGDIDPPIELSPNVIAWSDDAVERYLASRPRRVPPAPGTGKVVGKKVTPSMEATDARLASRPRRAPKTGANKAAPNTEAADSP
jgi:hypothetical protein